MLPSLQFRFYYFSRKLWTCVLVVRHNCWVAFWSLKASGRDTGFVVVRTLEDILDSSFFNFLFPAFTNFLPLAENGFAPFPVSACSTFGVPWECENFWSDSHFGISESILGFLTTAATLPPADHLMVVCPWNLVVSSWPWRWFFKISPCCNHENGFAPFSVSA